jgi:hypothetical protein
LRLASSAATRPGRSIIEICERGAKVVSQVVAQHRHDAVLEALELLRHVAA